MTQRNFSDWFRLLCGHSAHLVCATASSCPTGISNAKWIAKSLNSAMETTSTLFWIDWKLLDPEVDG